MIDRYGSSIVGACESTWAAIQEANPAVPNAVFIIGEGKGVKLGHFHAHQWRTEDDKEGQHEVLLAGERLKDGPEGVLETLLHEAAHALCKGRGAQDTSRQGRYHNKTFKAAAEELSLSCKKLSDTHGLAHTALTEESTSLYAPQLHEIQQVLSYYKRTAIQVPKAKKAQAAKAECDCGRKIPISYLPVICGECRTDFKEAE